MKLSSVNVFSFLSHKRVSLLLNAPYPVKMALTSPNFPIFKYLDLFSKVPNKLVNQQDTCKVPNFEQEKRQPLL